MLPLAVIESAVFEGFYAYSVFKVIDKASFVGTGVVFIVAQAFEEAVFPGALVVLPCTQFSIRLPMQPPL